jgi:hypothetical protein
VRLATALLIHPAQSPAGYAHLLLVFHSSGTK